MSEEPPPQSPFIVDLGFLGVKTVFQHEVCLNQLSLGFLTVKYGLSGIPKFTFRPIGIILSYEATRSSCGQTVDVYLNVGCSVQLSGVEWRQTFSFR
jgi:hypothetical protein